MFGAQIKHDQFYVYQRSTLHVSEHLWKTFPQGLQWGKYKALNRKRGKPGQLASASDKQKRKYQNFNGWVEDGLVFFSAVLFPSTELLNNWIKGAL